VAIWIGRQNAVRPMSLPIILHGTATGTTLDIQWTHEVLTMLKKLTKHGNSLALVIDRPILELLKIDTETALEISTDGRRLIVVPAGPSERRQKFEAAQLVAHKRYAKAFKKLAE